MFQYMDNIVCPYIEGVRERLNCPNSAALIIIDNFKGQITPAYTSRMESCNIHTSLLPPNTTDLLQPPDVSVNKPFNDFLRRKINELYSDQIMHQLKERSEEFEEYNLEPISMAHMKGNWLVDAADYISQNPSFLVNGMDILTRCVTMMDLGQRMKCNQSMKKQMMTVSTIQVMIT